MRNIGVCMCAIRVCVYMCVLHNNDSQNKKKKVRDITTHLESREKGVRTF